MRSAVARESASTRQLSGYLRPPFTGPRSIRISTNFSGSGPHLTRMHSMQLYVPCVRSSRPTGSSRIERPAGYVSVFGSPSRRPNCSRHTAALRNHCHSWVVLGELYSGFRAGARWDENTAQLARFQSQPSARTLNITPETAIRYSTAWSAGGDRRLPAKERAAHSSQRCVDRSFSP